MNRIRTHGLAMALAAGMAALAGQAPAAPNAATVAKIDEAMSFDGLTRTAVKGVELAYVRPGASLSGYQAVIVLPPSVSFHRDFSAQGRGTRLPISERDLAATRQRVADLVQDEFAKALKRGGYEVATAPGPNVLAVKPDIVGLYVNAPDNGRSGRSRSFAFSAGQMTLSATLMDSDTGDILARVIDRQAARHTGTLQMANTVTNTAEARDIANRWAQILVAALDRARAAAR